MANLPEWLRARLNSRQKLGKDAVTVIDRYLNTAQAGGLLTAEQKARLMSFFQEGKVADRSAVLRLAAFQGISYNDPNPEPDPTEPEPDPAEPDPDPDPDEPDPDDPDDPEEPDPQGQQDALARLRQTLDRYGLGSLADWAWNQIVSGVSDERILLNLRETEQFKQRFSGLEVRRQQGFNAISLDAYLQAEDDIKSVMRSWGLPPGFWDSPEDFANLIGNDVSANEVNKRAERARDLIAPRLAKTKEAFQNFYGVAPDDGALIAWALDPERGANIIDEQVRAATIGAAALQNRLQADRERAEMLARAGITDLQAEQGFSQVADELGTQAWQVGAQDEALTQTEAENAVFLGDQAARKRSQNRARQASSLFEGRGGVATERAGVTGLGSPRS